MKITAFMALLSLTAFTATAQHLKETEVPAAVKESFAKKYPGIKAEKWEKEGAGFEAKFDLDKVDSDAIFDATGAFVSQEQEVNISALPKEAADYCAKNYAGYKLAEAEKITDAAGTMTYEAELKKEKDKQEIVFDERGKFISVKKDD